MISFYNIVKLIYFLPKRKLYDAFRFKHHLFARH